MKTNILTLILGLSLSFSAWSQGRLSFEDRSPEEKAQAMTARLTKKLQLDETQQEEVQVLLLEQIKLREEDAERHRLEREAMAEKMKAILSEEQWLEFEQLQAERREQRQKRRQEHQSSDFQSP
jgi:hypothetical protein